jgi:hypothetical protein
VCSVTGLESLVPPADREAGQTARLLTDEKLAEGGPSRSVTSDNFEQWLGAIRLAA